MKATLPRQSPFAELQDQTGARRTAGTVLSQAEVATVLGISRRRVQVLEARALAKMRAAWEERWPR